MRAGRWRAGVAAVLPALAVLGAPAAQAACRPQNLARDSRAAFVRRVSFAASPGAGPRAADVTVRWLGHSFFVLTSKAGTRIATDPLGPGMYPTPKITAHAVTVGREHRNHNSVEVVSGGPVVLRGLAAGGLAWRRVRARVREVGIRSVAVYQTGYTGEPMKGAAFTFDFGRMCVAHLGDLAGPLTPAQLEEMGRVDVLLIPIGGRFTMGPGTARRVLRQVRPRVAIPMHYWDREDLLAAFLEGLPRRRLDASVVRFTRESLPPPTTVIVLRPPA